MSLAQVAVAAQPAQQTCGGVAGFGDGRVQSREESGHLLHRHRLAGVHRDHQFVTGTPGLVDESDVGDQRGITAPDRGAGRHGDRHP